jgi:FkbH-like protein
MCTIKRYFLLQQRKFKVMSENIVGDFSKKVQSPKKKGGLYNLLGDQNLKIFELSKTLQLLEDDEFLPCIKIGVSASVSVSLLGIYLRRYGLLNNVKIEVIEGNYDDPIGDIDRFAQAAVEQVVLLPFFDSLLPHFEVQLESIERSKIDLKEAEIRQRYRTVFEKARGLQVLYLGTFHRMGRAVDSSGADIVSQVLARFNLALREEAAAYGNIRILDSEDIVREVGYQIAFDERFYFLSKAPYTGAYLNKLAERVAASSRGFGAHFYKVLALDCDNTLWGGVIGEDLVSGIKLGPHDYPGNIFWRMQHEFSALERQGILLALVSKNNPDDVDEVLNQHPDMVIQESQFVVKKVNWDDKSSNLRALAEELNVGLDSIVFLDDSPFECDAVRTQLPMVKTMQVPATLSSYPDVVNQIKSLFLAGGIAADSKRKTEQYRQRADAERLKAEVGSQAEYLASLGLKVELSLNASTSAARISELSKKSNQFNLTTRRYTVTEIEQMMDSHRHAIYSLVVSDKFGNAGLTGVVVMHYEGIKAKIENFFMSCRVIGRGVESSIWTCIIADSARRGCTELLGEFIPSTKNSQVQDFLPHLGMALKETTNDGVQKYSVNTADFIAPVIAWIEVTYVG